MSEGAIRVSFLAGTVLKEDAMRFKRMIFRVTRGNTWTIIKDIDAGPVREEASPVDKKKKRASRNVGEEDDLPEYLIDPATGKPILKCVFLIVYQGGDKHTLKNKLAKICDSFAATRYHVPEVSVEFGKKKEQVLAQLAEVASVAKVTKTQLEAALEQFSAPRYPVQ